MSGLWPCGALRWFSSLCSGSARRESEGCGQQFLELCCFDSSLHSPMPALVAAVPAKAIVPAPAANAAEPAPAPKAAPARFDVPPDLDGQFDSWVTRKRLRDDDDGWISLKAVLQALGEPWRKTHAVIFMHIRMFLPNSGFCHEVKCRR